MRIFPAKDSARRTEQELRLQPFTLLAAIPVALVGATAITYTRVYSDSPSELLNHALLSVMLSLPAGILFGIVWKKEARRPFSLYARRIAWRVMFLGYLVMNIGIIALAYSFKASGSKLSGAVVFVILGLPIGLTLYSLSSTKE